MQSDDFTHLSEGEKIALLQQQQARIEHLEAELSRQIDDWLPLSADDFLRDVLATLPLILFTTDTEGRILFTRGSGLATFDLPEDRLRGQNLFEIYAHEEKLMRFVRRALDGERMNAVQVEMNGVAYRVYYYPLYERHTDPPVIVGMTAIITDIDLLQRTEQALRESERRMRAIFNSSYHYIALVDIEGFILDVNQTGMSLTQIPYGQMIGTRLWEITLIPDESVRHRLRESVELAKRGETIEMEFGLNDETRDRLIIIDFSIQPIYNDGGEVSVLLAEGRDVTERKKVEEAIDRAFRRERELSDLKSRFITTTSHEFRTPLAIISSSSFLLQRHYERLTESRREQHFRKIQSNVEHIAAMLDDILLLGQLQSRTWETSITQVNVSHMVYNAVQHFRALHGETHSFQLDLPARTLHLDADERLLQQVVINLLRNAVLFSPDGGTIKVKVRQRDQMILLHVEDEGVGIPQNEHPMLFDVFFRGSNADNTPGRGLGLAIVRDALRLHRGHISVDSRPNEGSVFTVRLPVTASSHNDAS